MEGYRREGIGSVKKGDILVTERARGIFLGELNPTSTKLLLYETSDGKSGRYVIVDRSNWSRVVEHGGVYDRRESATKLDAALVEIARKELAGNGHLVKVENYEGRQIPAIELQHRLTDLLAA